MCGSGVRFSKIVLRSYAGKRAPYGHRKITATQALRGYDRSMCPMDTTPEAWHLLLDLQRKMSASERLQCALEWSEVIRGFFEAGLRSRYPNADERELFLRAAKINLGAELFERAYGKTIRADESAG